jgi:hypothetical protein
MGFAEAWNLVKGESPELFQSVQADVGSQHRLDESQNIMDANPGLDRKSAMNLLRHQKPGLFPEGAKPADLEKRDEVKKAQQAIRDAIDALREKEPHLTFAMAWAKLTRTNPELFSAFETEGGD